MPIAQVKTTKTLLRSVNYLSCLSCVHKLSSLFPLNSSSRSIKRRKFDDELVESSLNVGTSSATPSNKLPRTRTPSLSTAVASSDCKYQLISLTFYVNKAKQIFLLCIVVSEESYWTNSGTQTQDLVYYLNIKVGRQNQLNLEFLLFLDFTFMSE